MPKKKEHALVHVRIPPDVKNWLVSEANINKRSINNEIMFALENEKARRAGTQQALNLVTTNQNLRGNSYEWYNIICNT